MAGENINLNKQVYAKTQYERVIDTSFTQLVQPVATGSAVAPTISVAEFLQITKTLFFEIPKFGDTNSHEYLIKTSQEYAGDFNNDETIQALIEEITQLRQENLDLTTTSYRNSNNINRKYIMAETVNIIPLNPNNFEFQEYSSEDNSLITSLEVETSFDPQKDKIEYFIYDLNGNILFENVTGYTGYRLLDNVLTLYPDIDLISQGYTEGQFNTLYNFVSPKLESNPNFTYFLSQISPDRTEVRLDTTSIPNALVISSSIELTNDITNSTASYYDFYLDFGSNQLVIANNILLDTSSIDNPTVLVKLYEPLPEQFTINSQLWVVTQVANPVAYNINLVQTFELTDDNIYLKGPNTNLSIKDQINNSTDYNNISQLSLTDSTQGSGSLRYQLNSLLSKTGIDINIDYSNYDNFIHFSSAQTRLENFYYKLSLIEQYNYSASYSTGTTC